MKLGHGGDQHDHGQVPLADRLWFATTPANAPTIGGFLHLTVALLASGMTASAIRWTRVDALHAVTGLRLPELDFSRLGQNVEAFVLLIEIHYRYYPFYANLFIAIFIAYLCYRLSVGNAPLSWPDYGFVPLEGAFLVTSRGTLRKYYSRSHQLLTVPKRERAMTGVTSPVIPMAGDRVRARIARRTR